MPSAICMRSLVWNWVALLLIPCMQMKQHLPLALERISRFALSTKCLSTDPACASAVLLGPSSRLHAHQPSGLKRSD